MEKIYSISAQVFACFAVFMCSFFLSGTVSGWEVTAMPKFSSPDSPLNLTHDQLGWIPSIGGIGAVFGPIVTSLLVDRIGRKLVIVMCGLPIILSYVIMIAKMRYWVVILSRVLSGVGVGLTMSTVPLYTGEITDNKIRGALGAFGISTMNFGSLFCVIIGPHLTLKNLNITASLVACAFMIFVFFVPESPYYYLLKGDTAKATKSLIWLRRTENVEAELVELTDYVEKRKSEISKFSDLVTKRGNRRPLIILTILVSMQMFSGSYAVSAFSYEIFRRSGLKISGDTAVLIMSALSMVSTLVGACVIDSLGRRLVLFCSTSIMTVSLIAAGVFFTLKVHDYNVSGFTFLPFASILVFSISYAAGLQPLPPIIVSEYFSTNVKANAATYYSVLLCLTGMIATKVFQLCADHLGFGTTFFMCAVPLIVGTTALFFTMPETKGCSLQEIEAMHNAGASKSEKKDVNVFHMNPT